MIDLSEYYSGGYFLIRTDKPGGIQLHTGRSRGKLLSLSGCICPRVEVAWGWIQGDREAALRFGIPESKLDEFVAWCGAAHHTEIDFVSMFHSVDAVRRFIKHFLPDTRNLYLIGAGLYKQLEETNWREPSTAPVEGIEKQIEQHLPLFEGGTPIGFEVVGFSHQDFDCSWLCTYLHEEMHKLFGIRPAIYGLIETREQAQQVNDWIAENKHRADPIPYDYWLLVSYPLNSQ